MVAQVPLEDIRDTIVRFVETSGQPVLCEPGEETVELNPENFVVECRNGALVLQAWDQQRNIVRRVAAIESQTRAKLVLRVERFGKRMGTLALIDVRRSDRHTVGRRAARLEFREEFRRFLRREFPAYKIAELSAEADLEHTLSPSYPRALLRQGTSAWAAIGAPVNGAPVDGVLSFGLIWLDYVRAREKALTIRGLILFLPSGAEKTTCLRLLFLNAAVAQYLMYIYSLEGYASAVDLRDYGNLDTRLERCQRHIPSPLDASVERLARIADVETIERPDGSMSLRVHGLEFAKVAGGELRCGLETKRVTRASNLTEIENLARGVARLRSPDAVDRANPLYLRDREAWLESRVRAQIEELDATLATYPVYGQVPAFAAAERGVLDLLAVDHNGRLAIVELKASEDIHLPLQAMDYWMRVKWHLDRGEFTSHGYFPGVALRRDPPRLLLVAPALDFHPTTERLLRFFSPAIEVERLGIGVEWRKELKVVSRS